MTNDEVLQGNKLIANFLGISVQEVRLSKDLTLLAYGEEDEMPDWVNIQYFQPNADWNELMLAYTKINKYITERSFTDFKFAHDTNQLHLDMWISLEDYSDTPLPLWKCIVEYIKWYNQQTK